MTAALALWLAWVSSSATVGAAQSLYFVGIHSKIPDERVASTAHTLARTFGGRICLSDLRGLQVEAAAGAARAMAWDERVERVAVSPDVSLELPRRSKKPRVGEAKQPMPAGRTLQRAPRHFKDWYFVVLDPARTDVSSADAIAALADEISAASGAKRVGGEFVKPPQGFRVSGTEEAALQIARDARVMWVEEVGPYLRATDPRPGEYWVAFRKAAGAPSGEPTLRRLAEGLAKAYGGRIAHLWLFGGFTLADMAEESARALSEDPRALPNLNAPRSASGQPGLGLARVSDGASRLTTVLGCALELHFVRGSAGHARLSKRR